MTSKKPLPSPYRKLKRDSKKNSIWDGNTPCESHDTAEEDGVIGEVDQPAPPSEKPEASRAGRRICREKLFKKGESHAS